MKLCQVCNGEGCEKCEYEGFTSMTSFVVEKTNRRTKMKYEDYQTKKNRSIKFDKKNAVREE